MARRRLPPAELFEAALEGDRSALARLLSLIERGDDEARAIGRLAYPRSGPGSTVGRTGAPGAGKSPWALERCRQRIPPLSDSGAGGAQPASSRASEAERHKRLMGTTLQRRE